MGRSSQRSTIVIPCEGFAREFHGKLLLACCAAERGHPAVLGFKRALDYWWPIASPGVYVGKAIHDKNDWLYRSLRELGWCLVCFDEEGLVYRSAEAFIDKRFSTRVAGYLDGLMAWGEENASLWQGALGGHRPPVHLTGNPRFDFLRPELADFYQSDVEALRARYGRILLLNGNFGSVNHFNPGSGPDEQRLADSEAGKPVDLADAGYADYRQRLFKEFLALVPLLAERFPDLSVVIRPHPSESHEPWRQAAGELSNVHVVHEGSIVPWLRAAECVVHNGCTTAIEAYLMGRPPIAYRPFIDEDHELALPNGLSWDARTLEEVFDYVDLAQARAIGAPDHETARTLRSRYLCGFEGPLAGDRMADLLSRRSEEVERRSWLSPQSLSARLSLASRALKKASQRMLSPAQAGTRYGRHVFPGAPLSEIEARFSRLQQTLGRFEGLRVSEMRSNYVFRIEPR